MNETLRELVIEYHKAPSEFHATKYWAAYEAGIFDEVSSLKGDLLRSGRYPYLSTFGFNDVIFARSRAKSLTSRVRQVLRSLLPGHRIARLPFGLSIQDIRDMAYHVCEMEAALCGAKPPHTIGMSTFGGPEDLFQKNGQYYSVCFLGYFLRYCFAHKWVQFTGDEVVVELGAGSGYQVEILAKLFPEMTILCFDMPAQIYLCQLYLSKALGEDRLMRTEECLSIRDASEIRLGKVHFFGNWQFPIVENVAPDLFWNAASFGEMEPHIVENYLSYVKGKTNWIYLLQARQGKETSGGVSVEKKMAFETYRALMSGYELVETRDAYQAHRPLSESGGYFEAIWRRSADEKKSIVSGSV